MFDRYINPCYVYRGSEFPNTSGNEPELYIEHTPITPFQLYDSCPTAEIEVRRVVLKRIRATYHMSFGELVHQMGGTNDAYLQPLLDSIGTYVNEQLKRDNSARSNNLIFLHSCELHKQPDSNLIVFDMLFYSSTAKLVDEIGRRLFIEYLSEALCYGHIGRNPSVLRNNESTYSVVHRRPQHYDYPMYDADDMERLRRGVYGSNKDYTSEAEENAHELLKGMLTKKEFEKYKLENYVIVKGTYGRSYKVQKGDMMEVTQKFKGKIRNYRLCIEPKQRNKICPTDEVVAKIKLIKANEKLLHKTANKFK